MVRFLGLPALLLLLVNERLSSANFFGDDRLRERQISEKGDALEIGQFPVEDIAQSDRFYECKLLDNSDYKDEHYMTKVSVLDRSNTHEKTSKKIEDYFVVIKKQLWNCKNKDASGHQRPYLYVVVNELIGIKEIAFIRHPVTIEVTTKHYLGKAKKTAWLREIAYFTELYTEEGTTGEIIKPCLFGGTIILEDDGKQENKLLNIEPAFRPQNSTADEEGKFKELKYFNETISVSLKTDGNLPKIILGTLIDARNQLGEHDSVSVCYQIHGVNEYPFEYRLKAHELHHWKSTASERHEYRFVDDYYFEFMVPIIEEVWLCRILKGEKDKDVEFLRVVNEVIGRQPVQSLSVHHTVVHVADFPQEDSRSFHCREIKYLHPETGKPLQYFGYFRLFTEEMVTLDMKLRDTSYLLENSCLFSTLVNPEGYDFRVGSRLEKIVGTTADIVKCTKKEVPYNSAFRTQIRFKTRVDDIAFSTKEIEKDRQKELFKNILHEVLECTRKQVEGATGKEFTFLRVKNIIDFLVPVHLIESYDGVKITTDYKSNYKTDDSKSVRIVEVKYLDPEEFHVFRFDGELEIDESESKKIPLFKYEIKKTKHDTVRIVGQHQYKYQNLRDLVYSSHAQWQLILDNTGTEIMELGINPKEELGSDDDVAECFISRGFYVTVALLKTGDQQEWLQENLEKSSEYIVSTLETKNLWNCTVGNVQEAYWFERGVNKGNKILNSKPLKKLLLYDGIDFRFVRRTAANYDIEFDDTHYINTQTQRNENGEESESKVFTKYYGQIVVKGKEKEIEGKQWSSGTMPVPDKEMLYKRVHYEIPVNHLDFEYLYKTVINDEGETLQLGSKWVAVLGSEDTTHYCKQTSTFKDEHFDTFFRTKVIKAGGNKNNVFHNYFQSLRREIWNCFDNKGVKMFHRVFNQFTVKHDLCKAIKEFLHYDGFTFLVGQMSYDREGCMEIVEVKYVTHKGLHVLKYEGQIVLESEAGVITNKIRAIRLKSVAKKDVDYLFNVPSHIKDSSLIYRKVVRRIGFIIQIEDGHEEIHQLVKPKSNFRCKAKDIEDASNGIPEDLRNRIKSMNVFSVHKLVDDNTLKPVNEGDLYPSCFYSSLQVWECKADNEQDFYRVVYKFVTKALKSVEPSSNEDTMCEIARVYHPSGVTVNVIDRGTKAPLVQIRQIKYFNAVTEKQVKFSGFVANDIDENKNAAVEFHFAEREVRYIPEFIHLNELPRTIEANNERFGFVEVGSAWQKKVGYDSDVARCVKLQDQNYDQKFGTKMFSNQEKLVKGKPGFEEIDVYSEHFKPVKQDIYRCMNKEGTVFYRILNFLVEISNQISAILHHDGVTVSLQTFPDGSKSIRLREVKYIDENYENVIKYIGKVTLVYKLNTKFTKWFQMPSDMEEYPVEIELEPRSSSKATFWPMEVLRIHALRLDGNLFSDVEKIEYETKKIKEQRIHTTVIKKGRNGRILVGSPWQKELDEKTEGIRCIRDEWNPTSYLQFTTRVVVYINDVHYVLDEETIFDYFKIKKIEIWICANDAITMLRVVTKLEGVVPIQVVEHYDGVVVKPIPLEDKLGEMTAQITECKYVSAVNFQVVKFGGNVMLHKIEEEKEKEMSDTGMKNAPNWGDFCKYWFNRLLVYMHWKTTLEDSSQPKKASEESAQPKVESADPK